MKKIRFVSAEEAVKSVKSGDHVHLSSVASAPRLLIDALCERGRAGELHDVRIHHLHTEGPAPYSGPEFEGIFFHQGFFIGTNVRKNVQAGYSDYIPVFLSETQKLYRSGALPCDVAMIQVCPPDEHGFVSLGTSVDATLAAIECAKTVIAVVNRNVPRAWGQAMIPLDYIDIFVEGDTPLEASKPASPNETEKAIGKYCAELIDDGACLQMGIGAIPNAVLAQLGGHKNLGIHTEMFADGVLDLVKKGVITGSEKVTDKGKIVSTFLLGSQECYDFIDDNPMVAMMDVGYTNYPLIISRNPKMTGQVDFMYGASRAKDGKAIIAMPSRTTKGLGKIVPAVYEGSGIVSTRAHVHWVVTEFGAVNLYGKSMQERAKLLTSIAHPDDRESLDRAAYERFGPHYHNFSI